METNLIIVNHQVFVFQEPQVLFQQVFIHQLRQLARTNAQLVLIVSSLETHFQTQSVNAHLESTLISLELRKKMIVCNA